jgi:parvulin-like peptidyl-prolyl isomerase
MKNKIKILLPLFILILIVSGVFIWFSIKYRPIAKVNGETILKSDYELLFNSKLNELHGIYGKKIPPDVKEKVKKDTIDELINRKLLLEEAKDRGIIVNESEVQKMLEDVKSSFRENEAFSAALSRIGITIEDFKDYIRDEIMIDKLRSDLGKDVKISKAEIKDYFEKNRKRFTIPEGYKIKIITANSIKEAEEIISKLKRGNIDFDKYALNQQNEFAKKINKINKFIDINLFPDMIKERIKKIKVGEYDGPIRDKDRFHIIKVLEKREEKPLKLEEVKDNIFHFLLGEKKEKLLSELIKSKRNKADIKTYE